MKDNQSSYSVAIVISIILHVSVLVILGINASSTPLKKPEKPKYQAIKAVVVSEQAVKQHAERIKRAEQDKRAKERQRQKQAEDSIKKLNEERRQKELAIAKAKQDQLKAEQAAKQAEKKRVQKEQERRIAEVAALKAVDQAKKAEQQRAKKELERQQAEQAAVVAENKRKVADEKRKVAEQKERERQAAIKRKKEEEVKLKAEQELVRLAAIEQDRLMQAEIEAEFASELDSEIQQLNAVRQQEVMGEVDKYTLRIKSTIQKHILTSDAMRGKSCLLVIRLTDSGLVRSVTSGEGDKLVCAAAVNAVNKAGSFPMSKDPDVAAKLKLINLSYEPEI